MTNGCCLRVVLTRLHFHCTSGEPLDFFTRILLSTGSVLALPMGNPTEPVPKQPLEVSGARSWHAPFSTIVPPFAHP